MNTSTYHSTTTSGEVVFTLKNNQLSDINENTVSHSLINEETDTGEQTESAESNTILSVIWKGNKLGAAYYNTNERKLYIVNDIVDSTPYFPVTRTLYNEVTPIYTITFGSKCDNYVKLVIDLINCDDETTVTSNEVRNVPENLSLLTIKNYSFEMCENAVRQLKLSSINADEQTETEKEIFLNSIINFNCKLSVHALGALIKFLEKNWPRFANEELLAFWQITQTTLKDNVFIDQNTFKGLQVFQTISHDSGFKQGQLSSNREGTSIYRLFSRECNSMIGKTQLRNLLLKPMKDLATLNKRLDFIELAIKPINRSFIENLEEIIRKLSDVHRIIGKIENSQGKTRDWINLFTTITHLIKIHELCSSRTKESLMLFKYCSVITKELYSLAQSIDKAIDFSGSLKSSRPLIKYGLDKELDAKKLRRRDVGKQITAAAKFAIQQLPPYLDECTIVYLPELGHLISFKEWEQNCDYSELQQFGFQYMYKMQDALYFKSPLCVELDVQLGDIHTEIVAHESRILMRLSGFVVKYNRNIREPLYVASLIDCLIAMSKIARANSYVRPALNTNNVHEIQDSRHPLLELMCSSVEANDFYSGGPYSYMKIITGPNASGKTVYLKQVALTIYLAHIGCFVPAKKANISIVHSIHSRIHSSESAAIRLSSFMIDICQMGQALYNAKVTSLVLVDEFGRGTTGDEGVVLLAGALKKFLDDEENCPHVLVSTHFQKVTEFIPRSRFVRHFKTDYTFDNDGGISFLFKVVEGVSRSFALEVAALVGVDSNIIKRAKEILHCIQNNLPIRPLPELMPPGYSLEQANNVEFFQKLNVPEFDD